jgi:hypothetical protein
MNRAEPEVSWEAAKKHRAARIRKLEQIAGLKALLQEWEGASEPDFPYLRQLRLRLRSAEAQLEAMKE